MPKTDRKNVLLGEGVGEITEKKSRFIAHCFAVRSEDEALKKIEELRKQYWDARHNCYAYVIGKNSEIMRFSDDKEPQGTAGKPILDVITGNQLINTLIVVTRYFGGVLLGAGGLVRAYSAASVEGLKNCTVSEIYAGVSLSVTCDYAALGKIQYLAGQLSGYGTCCITDTSYAENVTFQITLEESLLETFRNKVTEATSGQGVISAPVPVEFAMKDDCPVYL